MSDHETYCYGIPYQSHIALSQYLPTILIYHSRVRTEKEEELLALENYWKERLATQEAETVHRQKLTEQEVK